MLQVLNVKNLFEDDKNTYNIKVLSCDSVSQAKRKILDVLYGNVAYSQRMPGSKADLGELRALMMTAPLVARGKIVAVQKSGFVAVFEPKNTRRNRFQTCVGIIEKKGDPF